MSDLPEFNQENINSKITEIKSYPDDQRKSITDEIREDFRGWLLQTFTFPEPYIDRLNQWPQSLRESEGCVVATGLYYPDWELVMNIPEQPAQVSVAASRTKHSVSISGEGNPQTGQYTVKVTYTISW